MNYTPEEAEIFEKKLVSLGYRKFKQGYKHEDFLYWKSFERVEDEEGDRSKGYSVGFAFYDYSKHLNYPFEENVGVALEFMLGSQLGVDRLDLSISDDNMTLEEFEHLCAEFYKFYINLKT